MPLPELSRQQAATHTCHLHLSLCSLSRLIRLSLQSNRLARISGLSGCTALEELYLSHNGLTTLEVRQQTCCEEEVSLTAGMSINVHAAPASSFMLMLSAAAADTSPPARLRALRAWPTSASWTWPTTD